MSAENCPEDRVLLVEGRDDREAIYQFCNHYKIDNSKLFCVEVKDGIKTLLDHLVVRPRTGDVKVLGAVIDADVDPNARWEQVRAALAKSDYVLPTTPTREGTILEAPKPRRPQLGIWLMPDNEELGTLEDFFLRLVNEEDRLISRAENVVDSIPEEERLFGNTKRSKAIIHTWLAWQEEPGTPLGLSIKRCYLDPTRNPAPEFKAWLEKLFVPD